MSVALNNIQSVDRGEDEKVSFYNDIKPKGTLFYNLSLAVILL